jgi:hypothetical protein
LEQRNHNPRVESRIRQPLVGATGQALELAAAGRCPSTVRNIVAPVRAIFATALGGGVLIRWNPVPD